MILLKRTLVISDIHGEFDLFERLLVKASYTPEEDQLILLGDYVDRGPNAKKVLEKVIQLKAEGALVLKGNHEDMMIKALTTNDEHAWKNWTYRNGGSLTLQSYGFNEDDYIIQQDVEFTNPYLQSKALKKHVQFIETLDHVIEWEDYIFVHAGVDPETQLKDTDPYIFMWIRENFHKFYNGQKTIIFGHTPTKYLHAKKNSNDVFFGNNRIIGIDGAAAYGGQLNCLQLPEMKVFTVKANK